MADELPGAAPTDAEAAAANRARVAASNHAFGRVLSWIGWVLVAVTFVLLVGGGLVLTVVAHGDRSDTALRTLGVVAGVGMGVAPGVLLLFAMCALVTGEQLRRGAMTRTPPGSRSDTSTASWQSRFRVLPIRWHVCWIVVGTVVSAILVGLPAASWFTGGWPSDVGDQNAFATFWVIYGSLGFGVTVAAVGSLIKKVAYGRTVRDGRAATALDLPGRPFWRWFDHRWRFDVWLAGIGGLVSVLSLTALSSAVGPTSTPDDLHRALPYFLGYLSIGLSLFVIGVACACNFWRAGEDLGSGEGVT